MHSSFKIIKGEKHHLISVLSLINELAVFEKEPDAVTNTLPNLIKNWEDSNFDFVVVTDEKNIIGFALFYFRYSTWKGLCLYLEDFYIQPSYRSRGIGNDVFDRVVAIGKEKGCVLLNWQVLDWNKEAIKFYKRKKADISEIWYNGTLKL